MNSEGFIAGYFATTKETTDRLLDNEMKNISAVIDTLFEAWKHGRQVFIFGNGGSASNASHFLCDIVKYTNVEGKPRFRGMCLNDNHGLVTAHINDNGWENLYVEQLKNHMNEGDVVIALSVHGGSGRDKAGAWSQNLLKALDYANRNGARTIGFSGFDGGAFKEVASICVTVPVNSTPHVESFHALLHHLICDALKEKIKNM